jgi:outer membrane protein TolC
MLPLLLGSLPCATKAQPAQPLTLAEVLDRAETASPALLLSREASSQARSQADQQRVNLLPYVGLSGAQRRSETVAIVNGSSVQTPAGNRFDGKLTGSLNLLNPQQRSAYQAAQKGFAVAELDVLASRQAALAACAQAFFTHLRNLRRLDLLTANVERAKALLSLARNQVSAGTATRIDTARAEALLAQAELSSMQQATTLVSSELALQRLLDLPAGQPLSLQPFSVRRVSTPALPTGPLAAWREKRPDFLRAQAAVEQARMDVRTARAGRLPSLALSGEYGTVAPDLGSSDRKQAWLAGATLSVPLFDGLRSSADRRLALSRLRAQEIRLQQLCSQIDAELLLAYQDASSRHAQIAVAETNLRLSQEELQLARNRFVFGAADNREIIEAQNRLAQAEDGLLEAEHQYRLSRLELARAAGDVRAILAEADGTQK